MRPTSRSAIPEMMGSRRMYDGSRLSDSLECIVWLCSDTPVRKYLSSRRLGSFFTISVEKVFIPNLGQQRSRSAFRLRGAVLISDDRYVKLLTLVYALVTFVAQ